MMRPAHRSGMTYADDCNGYPYQQDNGGRHEAGKKWWGDCGVIALAIATSQPYDVCAASLREDGGFNNSGVNLDQWIHALQWQEKDFHGFTFTRRTFKAIKGQVRMRPAEFCRQHPTGRFIIQVSRHYLACVDGVMRGEYPVHGERCIYSAYEVTK